MCIVHASVAEMLNYDRKFRLWLTSAAGSNNTNPEISYFAKKRHIATGELIKLNYFTE